MKRIFDFSLSLILIILLSPLMLYTALLIAIKMGKPIIFKQPRPGFLGKPFLVYKFRTMIDARDKDGKLLLDAKRIHPLGLFLRKYSLDEFPQLINVLKGDMSFVGPRPLLMEYLSLYSSEQARRHNVKPGITGWAQVNGRNAISWEDKFKLDVWYVDNRSFWLDLQILWMTFKKVLNSEGVNQEGQATVEKFKGE